MTESPATTWTRRWLGRSTLLCMDAVHGGAGRVDRERRAAVDRQEVDFSQENLSWVVNGYVLTFGGFLLLGGRMADLLGRRRMFMGGLVIVAVASLAGASRTEGALIAARAARASARRSSPGRALDRHDDVPGRRGAQQGAGRLGRGGGKRRRRRRAARRRAHRRS